MAAFEKVSGRSAFDIPDMGKGMGKPGMPVASVPIAAMLPKGIYSKRQNCRSNPDYTIPRVPSDVSALRYEPLYTFEDPESTYMGTASAQAIGPSAFTSMNGLTKADVGNLTFLGIVNKEAIAGEGNGSISAVAGGPGDTFNTGDENIPSFCQVYFDAPIVDESTGLPAVNISSGSPSKVFPATRPMRMYDVMCVFGAIYHQVMAAADAVTGGNADAGNLTTDQLNSVASACAHTHEVGKLYLSKENDPCWKYVRYLMWTLGDKNTDWKIKSTTIHLNDYQSAIQMQSASSAGRRQKMVSKNGFGAALVSAMSSAPAQAAGSSSFAGAHNLTVAKLVIQYIKEMKRRSMGLSLAPSKPGGQLVLYLGAKN